MVVQAQEQPLTVTDFDDWVMTQSDNYEFIAGEVVAVVSNNYASQIAARILTYLGIYVLQHNNGHLTGSDGGYHVNGQRYIPDVGFISKAKQPQPSHEAYNVNAPDLAVEVVSPTDDPKKLMIKVSHYLAAGTEVWVIYPLEREAHIYRAGQGATMLDEKGQLQTALLPGFELSVKDIFPPGTEED